MQGIYLIENTINNKVYVGSSTDIERRWGWHIEDLIKKRHKNKHLQSAYNVYGIENFRFELIEEVLNKDRLCEREQHYMDFKESYVNKNGYNMGRFASSPFRGEHHTNESLIKMRSHKGKNGGKNNPMYGKHHTKEAKQKQRLKAVDRKATDKTRKKMRESAKYKPPVSKKTRRLMSKASKGRKHSEAVKQRNSEWHLSHFLNKTTRHWELRSNNEKEDQQ